MRVRQQGFEVSLGQVGAFVMCPSLTQVALQRVRSAHLEADAAIVELLEVGLGLFHVYVRTLRLRVIDDQVPLLFQVRCIVRLTAVQVFK